MSDFDAKPCEGGVFSDDSILIACCTKCFRNVDAHRADQATARGVRGERAAIVLFLRNSGFVNIADRVERCEHAEDALRIASLPRVDFTIQKDALGNRAVAISVDGVLQHSCWHDAAEASSSDAPPRFAVGDTFEARGLWSLADPGPYRVHEIDARGYLRVTPDGVPPYWVNPAAVARKVKS